ncbi:Fic family protein [Candidatus Daviesbacteria bacterium]|nr:Fic family protein [Candidatus Daviesbacteria bacterium]
MLIPPKYFLTSKISLLLSKIEAAKEVINSISIPPEIEINIRRQSTLKSSLFSARIEGNPLTLEEVNHSPSKDQRKREVYNILKALNLVYQRGFKDLTDRLILELHKIVLDQLTERDHLDKFRTESGAIFNAVGIAIYLSPPPRQIPLLMARLTKFANSPKEQFIPIRACSAHYVFEKIHPFLDGNGRVGRLLIQAILTKGGYGMKGLLSLEEYLDNHRSEYYRSLEGTEKDVTDYLEFMLEAINQTAQQTKELVLQKKQAKAEDYLLPRRAEILNIIKDQKLVGFDVIRRRFMAVNERTLRYDLKQLQNQGLIRKLGSTKGAYYEPIRNSTTSPSLII